MVFKGSFQFCHQGVLETRNTLWFFCRVPLQGSYKDSMWGFGSGVFGFGVDGMPFAIPKLSS